MSIVWFERIDREQALDAARGLLPDGGLLVVRGDDLSGRPQTARLLCDFFVDRGVQCISGHDTAQGSPLKGAVMAVRAQLEPSTLGALPGWVADASKPARIGLEGLSNRLSTLDGLRAVVLEEVDANGPLGPAEIMALSEMATSVPCALTVTSRAESRTRWAVGGKLVPGMVIHTLPMFARDDVRRVLLQAPELTNRPVSDLDAILDALAGGSDGSGIVPMHAYAAVRALQ
jgi:hypothetical protein